MNVTVERIADFPLPDTSHGRTPGVHVSSIIKAVAVERGILTVDDLEELSLVDASDMSNIGIIAQLRIHMGLAWEEHYLPLIPDVVKHPGEVCVDAVYMTPDGESVSVIFTVPSTRYGLVVHEVKCTYKSTKTTGADTGKPLEGRKNFMWLAQLKAYCKAKKTCHGVLHVLHVCGNYVRPISPQLIKFHCEFTPEEIRDNWDLLLEYKEMRLLEGVAYGG